MRTGDGRLPVGTRTLAGYGAEVLRIDPPSFLEPGGSAGGGDLTLGKRCVYLDFATGYLIVAAAIRGLAERARTATGPAGDPYGTATPVWATAPNAARASR